MTRPTEIYEPKRRAQQAIVRARKILLDTVKDAPQDVREWLTGRIHAADNDLIEASDMLLEDEP